MKMKAALFCGMALVCTTSMSADELPQTDVSFHTSDPELQRLFDAAETKAVENTTQFTPEMKVLVEGGGYPNAWIETQSMGGEMYAKRDLQIALNNQVIFMLGQRADGRMPGMVVSGDTARKRGWDERPPEGYAWLPEHDIAPDYEMFQGYCFPAPAWRMYFWIGKDKGYLQKLYAALKAHDAYLWRTRDSNGDGLLETWCVWDTGEDHSTRLTTRGAPNRWPFEKPPGTEGLPDPQDPQAYPRYWAYQYRDKLPPPTREEIFVPFASMDIMAYSYADRTTLAKIARELGNGREAFWREQSELVRKRLVERLWDPKRHACFDRDRLGRTLEELVHNNLRCMWYGIFTQEMADAFIRHHLLNPNEFWTPVPLVSIAINEPLYRNAAVNNWSGQPQGLTYQRAIGALENYGHYAEVTLIGEKLLSTLIRNGCTFPQQLDPTTGAPSGPKPDGYGPMILAALEYISRMHGIHLDVEHDRVWWSGFGTDGKDFTYTQCSGAKTFVLSAKQGQLTGHVNDRECFRCSAGLRVVTDLDGQVLQLLGIAPSKQQVSLQAGSQQWEIDLAPNQVIQLDGDKTKVIRAAPFDYPYRPQAGSTRAK
jgi:hypothetical protein